MPGTADEDRQRLHESRYDTKAAENGSAIATGGVWLAAVTKSRDELAQRRSGLLIAVVANNREAGETDTARLEVTELVGKAKAHYRHVRGKVMDRLLNYDPDEPVSALEIERLSRLVTRVFQVVPSQLKDMGPATAYGVLETTVADIEANPEIKTLGLHAKLGAAVADAKDAVGSYERERGEDKDATAALNAARKAFDRAHGAHADQVASVLKRAGRIDEVGRFVLSRDAAYAARRRTGQPISKEPGIEQVDEELEAQPDA